MMQKLSRFVRFDNPVLQKELKLRFRYFKSVTGLIVYLTTLLIFVGGFLLVALEFNQVNQLNPSDSFALFIMLSIIQMGQFFSSLRELFFISTLFIEITIQAALPTPFFSNSLFPP